MPEIFRFFGFSFFFYSKEHEPIHVHIEGNGGYAKFEWNGESFVMIESDGIKVSDLKKIKNIVSDNSDIIVKRWNDHFNR
ncbi:MAG: DUF4160 domain-containing protein [Paludibacteraceae bacterium]|jgi:hypothetical protein|nr:DUF4160 domain-containing protein [Paludibacteraceae bacterium]MBQ6732736.1 DUF4160 domain-containing protein [Paludibacteraceae bacterium]